MNYKEEPFPENMSTLIKKCDIVIGTIKDRFSSKNCLKVEDLYLENSSIRQKDFLSKLKVICNTKLNDSRKNKNEVKGLYVFGEINDFGFVQPIYVGISRTVFRRLYQHTFGKLHNETSFSYLKAKYYSNHKGLRKDLQIELLQEQQNKIKKYRLIVIPEEIDYDLYFMEVYIAGKLKAKWNSFKTH